MAIICCICGKRQSGWIEDYPLSPELDNFRICTACGGKYQKIQNAAKLEDVSEEIAYLKEKLLEGEQNEVVMKFLTPLFDKSNTERTLEDVNDEITKQRNEAISRMMVTSGYNFEEYKITRYCEYISTETVLGMGALKSLLASVSSVVGTESVAFNSKISEAKSKVLYEIKRKALELGANAIIGIDIDFSMIIDNMIVIIASGTAVFVEHCE